VVKSKKYGFNFSSTGHGGYLISANGGIFNHTRADQNNSKKSFQFHKGDVVVVEVRP